MSGDNLTYSMASETESTSKVFVRKDWLSILDTQSGNYRGNQSTIDTSTLSNSGKFLNYREAYLSVPLVLTLTGNGLVPATAATSVDYGIGLKNWFGSIVHSFSLDVNGVTIVQQTPLCGLWNSFKLMTTLSMNDVQTIGASIGFYPDSALSVSFDAVESTNGLGTSNNQNYTGATIVTGALNSYLTTNEGLFRRQTYINYDPDGLTDAGSDAFSTLLPAASCNALYKSYISQKTNVSATMGVIQFSIMAIIQLKHLHSFFQNVPLLRGVFMKATINFNQPQVTFQGTTDKYLSIVSSNNPLGGVCPIMIASAKANNGLTAWAFNNAVGASNLLYASLCVGNQLTWSTQVTQGANSTSNFTSSIMLNVPSFSFNPVFEQAYLSNPIKRIVYEDIYQYSVLNVPANGSFNNLITNGIAGIKSILVLPFYTATANGGVSPIQSIFDPAGAGPTSPLCLLSNFNVVVSGSNAIYNTTRYSYQTFMEQLNGCNAINAGLTDGLTSSLISQLDFETSYCYHYVDLSRMLPIEDNIPKSVTIIGSNLSAKAVDLLVFISYSVEVKMNVSSGLIV